ncbi:MAG: DUF255 domain-containing protein [Bacteroidetes bacterium]|jgi:uncharacterized protein YyaL (SSP411 family)|nr:DUF255 domain-containing protein [Bacteroidota bacterium]
MTNRLDDAQSPYLLQHKDNPVAWWPWCDEAFEVAKAEDKPVFLSIGYSTCHWCHVMAHESFQNIEVAGMMNMSFVNIKVDREERPDLDQLYMTVCQMMTGRGGWPLTVLLTPDKRPFFAGTYLPRESRQGQMGMLDFIPRVREMWNDEEGRAKLLSSADEVVGMLEKAAQHEGGAMALDPDALHLAYTQLDRRFDTHLGGFGTAPKFPSPHNLLFLLRYWKRTGQTKALRMVEKTLQQMRLGGIFDHVGYGFHRYSTDQEWKLPHFEKMLYDQAMLAMAYVEAFQATGASVYEQTAREVLTYVLRDMTDDDGGFYSAEDADSEGREGTFYVWTADEVREVLSDELADLFMRVYRFEKGGNFQEEATRRRTGENIPHLKQPIAATAQELGLEPDALKTMMATAREQLFEHRDQRVHPGKDDKVLTDWNGLTIAAFAQAARVFDEPEYAAAARRAADFLLATMRTDDGRLLHRWRNGEAAIHANLDDYAFLIWGLLDLYETTFEVDYLHEALALHEQLHEFCWDGEHGAYFFAPEDTDDLIVRQKESYDGAVPSGNSVAMLNLVRLGRLTGDTAYEQQAEAIGQYFAEAVMQRPAGFTAMLMALGFILGPSYEIVIAGEAEADDTQAMLRTVRSEYVPDKVVLLRPPGDAPPITEIAAYTEAQHPVDERATAYVCQDFACEQPTTDVDALREMLTGSS